jgi:hypothetical protein
MREEPPLSQITERIDAMEAEHQIHLTPRARQLLVTPIVEAYEHTGRFSPQDVANSLAVLFQELRNPEHEGFLTREQIETGLRSSAAVIRAIAELRCRIPPICGRP